MKRTLAGIWILLAVTLCAGIARAAGPPLVLAHTLTAQSRGDTSLTLRYALHVENTGESALTDLSLTLLPLPPLRGSSKTINVGTVGSHQGTDVILEVEAPTRLEGKRLAQAPLFFAGKYLDAEGKAVELPLKSLTGGAR